MKNNYVIFDEKEYKKNYEEYLEKVKQDEKEKRNISVSLRAKEKEKDTNISLDALKELKNVGFDPNNVGTLFLANIIEDLYCERILFDSSSYFDLSNYDNIHYKYVLDRYQVNDENFYRGEIAKSIATSKFESKNINDIVYFMVEKLSKKYNKTKIFE